MKREKGFTLIELLVVIAIIALLLGILLPALSYVRQQASAAVCGANQAGLGKSWYLYQEEHDGRLVGLSNYHSGGRRTPYRWLEQPLYEDWHNPGAPPEGQSNAVVPDAQITHEYELNGIRAGKLFPYTESEKLYHCPADKNWVKAPSNYAVYISYAGAGLMNSEDFNTRTGWPGDVLPTGWRTVGSAPGGNIRLGLAQKFDDIASPGDRYIFVEEDYYTGKGQNWYRGGFVLMANANYWSWWDWPADYHNNRSTLAFADGHTEKRTWRDPRTISIITNTPMPGTNQVAGAVQVGNEDMEWLNRGYLAMGFKR